MNEIQNYYITPPTIFLPEEGIKITAVGTDDIWIDKLSDDIENTFPTVPITFYHLDSNTVDQWQWLYHMVETSDLIMINVSKATILEMNMIFLHMNPKMWFYVDKKEVDKNIRILLNIASANIFTNSEELHAMLRNYVDA